MQTQQSLPPLPVRRRPAKKFYQFPSEKIRHTHVDKNKLTPMQMAFVHAMANIGENGERVKYQTQAAIEAGYSAATAGMKACQLMKDPKIAEAIDKLLAKKLKRFDITPDRVLQEVAALAFSNKADFYDEEGRLKSITALPRDVSAALSSVEVSVSTSNLGAPAVVQKIRLHDKVRALELLGRNLKLFTDKIDLSGMLGIGSPDEVQQHDQKAREAQAKLMEQLRADEEAEAEVNRIVREAEKA